MRLFHGRASPVTAPRDVWTSRMGVILAMAGNAIGLGNFLRFPTQAAQNGGGAFLIPYFVALILLGLPLMWIEWAMGRYGGAFGRGSAPGVFHVMVRKYPAAKYIGILGVVLPLIVLFYYVYVESWTLAYAVSSLAGQFPKEATLDAMKGYLTSYQGVGSPAGVGLTAYGFFLAAILFNYLVLTGGVSRGIERLATWGMPLLFLLALILMVRVLTLPGALDGLGFLWNPDWSQLKSGKVWLAAAGQVFFTLSLGFGCMLTYASYLRRRDDLVVTGLSTATTNEFAEVILGGSIAIPAAVIFFGVANTTSIAQSGSFNLGFIAMPAMFAQMPGGAWFGFFWFLLLFLAAITSSVALCQPAVAFLKDDLGWSHAKAVRTVAMVMTLAAHVPVLGLRHGALDEMDFWAGNVGIVLFGLIEVLVFMWIFGGPQAWTELHEGAELRLPRVFYYVFRLVTPLFLLVIFAVWIAQTDRAFWTLSNLPASDRIWRWGVRALIVAMVGGCVWLIRTRWQEKKEDPS